jgi:hypothetical protein
VLSDAKFPWFIGESMNDMNGGGISDVPDQYGQGTHPERSSPSSARGRHSLHVLTYMYICHVYILPCLLCNFGSVGLVISECRSSVKGEEKGDHCVCFCTLHVVILLLVDVMIVMIMFIS